VVLQKARALRARGPHEPRKKRLSTFKGNQGERGEFDMTVWLDIGGEKHVAADPEMKQEIVWGKKVGGFSALDCGNSQRS